MLMAALDSIYITAVLDSAGFTGLAVVLGSLYCLYRWCFRGASLRSVDTFSNQSPSFKALRRKHFPPPYPNGWYRICNSVDIDNGQVKSIAALGTHFVAFRNSKGRAGVLHAFCPHLGAHLGEGGVVKDDCLVCPFHEWAFDVDGKVQNIPYTSRDVPDRAKTDSYVVRETLGMIMIWFHAENELQRMERDKEKEAPAEPAPDFELDSLHTHPAGASLVDGVETGRFYYVGMKQICFDQHVCEMHMNSADPHHFQTLHGPLPIPPFDKIIRGRHDVKAYYEYSGNKHQTLFTEKMLHLKLFGLWELPLSAWTASHVDTNVIFEGPSIMHFSLRLGFFGEMRQVQKLVF